jgi:hypothetical protein
MSSISLRLPQYLHARVRKLAAKESVSINQLITLALAEKLSVLMAEEYYTSRFKKASQRKFLKALSKVPNVQPEPNDQL